MKYNLRATSIVEALVIMLIVVIWTVWMYSILASAQKLSDTTHNRIEAIQIAREWIETVMNIRDTNALLFQADLANCWNVSNYNWSCLWDTTTTYDIPHDASFVVYQDPSSRRILSESAYAWTGDYLDPNYRAAFRVNKINDFYTQTWWVAFTPTYTRELHITYLNDDWSVASDSNTDKMQVQSIVQWMDGASKKPFEFSLKTVLTNWRKTN